MHFYWTGGGTLYRVKIKSLKLIIKSLKRLFLN